MPRWLPVLLGLLLLPATAHAQVRDTIWSPPPPPVVPLPQPGETIGPGDIPRTAAALAGAAAAFWIAYAFQVDPEDVAVPIAAGALGGALATFPIADAPPLRVFIGAILAAVPAGAIAAYAAGRDDEPEFIPVIAFAIPEGLLTSAIARGR